ncbi:MAG: YegS/Rv2252/BmrU family lipid kinase [Clostridia bacterium]|nr:YegS/Rv2252/BmrU family lipid kinase [Clostridia bacterium]
MLKPLLIIMNPCSGTRQGPRMLAELISYYQTQGYQCTVMMTQKSGDATEFARIYGGQYPLVIAVGGDGTFNEVACGLISGGHSTPIGYLPAGSTNDFANTLSLSPDLMTAAKDTMTGTVQVLDAGGFNERMFTYVASFGAFTRVSYATPQQFKNTMGHLAYILEGVMEVPTLRAVEMTIETDDEVLEGDYIFGAISNSTSIGGMLKLDPGTVDMNDGKLELLLIRNPQTPIELGQILLALNTRDYASCSCIRFVSTKTVCIKARNGLMWSLDGEGVTAERETTITNLHNALRVVVPQGKTVPTKKAPFDDEEIEDLIGNL